MRCVLFVKIRGTFKNYANILAYLGKLTAVYPREWLSRRYSTPRQSFPRLCSSILCRYCSKKKLPEWALTKTRLPVCVLSIINRWAITCMGTSTIRLHSIKSSLPSLYSLRHSRDKLFQALSAFLYCKRWKAGLGLGTRLNLLHVMLNGT